MNTFGTIESGIVECEKVKLDLATPKELDGSSTTSSEDKKTENQCESPKSGNSNCSSILQQISKDIVDLINTSSSVPFIGVAGAGASGKSYFC